jgi:hypothetical protein
MPGGRCHAAHRRSPEALIDSERLGNRDHAEEQCGRRDGQQRDRRRPE